VKRAIDALTGLPDTRVIQDAGYYVSRPMGPEDQPDYINTVVLIETRMSPQQLLDACRQIEHQQGRIRGRHWGERSIDLDILLYGDRQIETDMLTIPHPGITQRDFVYLPLLAIDDTISLPGRGQLKAIIEHERTEDAGFACRFDASIDRD
jgi:2-amino-4-hydroxy-6-hydroxymethyldihydropteridine diphosphokinase